MTASALRFGPFLLDRTAYRLLKGSQAVALTPQLLDLLIHFVDRAGSLVTKDELLESLWANANVTENAVAHAISDLRQALGDSAGSPQFIKTIARRGYRFIASVEDAKSATVHADSPTAIRHEDEARTIAILDFVNVTGDTDSAWLSAGIAEIVSNDLRSTGHFRVVDRQCVVDATRRTDGSFQAIAAEIGARLMVLGSIQRHAAHMRVTARIVDVASGEAVADAKVDGPLDRVFELQDQVVAQLLTTLGVGSHATALRNGHRETPSLAAYRAFVEGWLHVESLDVQELPEAVVAFERALDADPRYALAYAGLASAEFALYESTRTRLQPDKERLDRAIAHARRAVELDDHIAEGHATLALILVSAWQTDEAARAARRAVTLEPSNWRHLFRLGHATWGDERLRAATRTLALYPDFAYTYFQMAMVHVARGHLAEAEAVLRRGAAIQDRQLARGERYPALGLHWLLGLVRLAEHDPADALHEFDRELEAATSDRLYGLEYATESHYGRSVAYMDLRRIEEGINSLQRALRENPDHVPARLALREALQRTGRPAATAERAKLDEILNSLATTRPIDGLVMKAQRLAADSQTNEAMNVLEQLLFDAPSGFVAWSLPVDPRFRLLQNEEGFRRVLSRLAARAH